MIKVASGADLFAAGHRLVDAAPRFAEEIAGTETRPGEGKSRVVLLARVISS